MLEMEEQLKETKKNQSFLPLTAVQTGNEVVGAGNNKNRRRPPGHRSNSASTDPRRREGKKTKMIKDLGEGERAEVVSWGRREKGIGNGGRGVRRFMLIRKEGGCVWLGRNKVV